MHGGNHSDPYPEVTGYLIPTLLGYDRRALAERCGAWLLGLQQDCGAFPNRQGNAAHFDTGAILQGLRALGLDDAAGRAAAWLEEQYSRLAAWRCYHALSAAQVGRELDCQTVENERVHYRAYWLEGVQILTGTDYTREWDGTIHRFRVDGTGAPCVCGNIQMAWLTRSLPFLRACAAWQRDCGGFPSRPGGRRCVSWAAKYYLDAAKELDR